MGNIVLLDDLTINKIAAGEVIERPANVVKELVENSIDAGATSISIDIENGGITYIRISDNGKGIAPDDVEIAFERHATSKIRKAEDLIKVSTMGFRGEALASIAAVAKVELITRTKGGELGTKIVVESGKIIEKEECGAPFGTTITVRELFYNTPVRYKFLKKDFTEGGYIEDAVSKIALVNPNISFRMTNNKKEIIRTSGNGDMIDVVYSVFGKDIAKNLVKVDSEYEGIKVTGVAGKPEIARSNRTNQLFYVNGRNIRDKILMASAEEAYRTLIPHGKFGFCILNIEINPELIDVNVHPAKLEIRFAEEGNVFKAVNIALKNALLKQDITVKETDEDKKTTTKGLFDFYRPIQENKKEEKQPLLTEIEKYDETENKETINYENNKANKETKKNINLYEQPNITQTEKQTLKIEEEREEYIPKKQTDLFENITIEEEKPQIPDYKILGVAFNTYILLELDDDIYILDQHAAHERVLYEKVKANFYKEGGKEAQMLLLPDVLELSKKDMHTVKNNIELFNQAGFSLEEFGDNTIKITGVPVMCFEMDTKDLFMDILDGLDITNRTTKQDVEEKFIATVACKAAIKANMSLDEREIRGLLDELLLLENPFTCPHGRPTAIRITKTEIEKKFGRK